MRYFSAVFAVFILLFSPVGGVHAAPAQGEKILLFDATAVFDATGTMEVTEKITVRAAGGRIKRGIFRTLPNVWDRADGKRFALAYAIESVLRDGKQEPYRERKSEQYLSVYIGDKEVVLPPGVYTYTITYTVRNHFSRFPDWDELYWNVTGNQWEFPIDKVRFRLLFRDAPGAVPRPMPMRSLDLYTGRLGAQGKSAHRLADGSVETTAPLRPKEGVTIAWTWPRDLLAAAPDPEEYSPLKVFFLPNSRTAVLWLAPLLMALYFCVIYFKMRPGPMPEVIPLFRAPENFSPGMLRYVVTRRYDVTAFAADLLHLVSEGAAVLDKGTKYPMLRKGSGERYARRAVLQAEEQAAVDRLFSRGDSVSLSEGGRAQLREARAILEKRCSDEKKSLLLPVIRYRVLGGLLLPLSSVLAVILFSSEGAVFLTFALIFAFFWIGFLLFFVRSILADVSGGLSFLARLPLLLFTLPFFGAIGSMGVFLGPEMLRLGVPDGFGGAILASFLLWVAGCLALPRRTAEGQRRLAIAKGLQMYLGTAERDRFAELYPPAESVQHFEELLPYALALDKGKTWANRFETFLMETGAQSEVFTDASWNSLRSFRSSAGSAVVRRSRSSDGGGGRSYSGSGSSGGGSSGRGSGGGGGGGW
ncbi:DUF2207 domain-containing protein [Desulfovibrio sp. OttesenSCG-928-O18]|nr:DUF2207 domain-containing protein [Desulfovibrio sp. OttesenSCG-928-O18]